jgi:hypothetical protein
MEKKDSDNENANLRKYNLKPWLTPELRCLIAKPQFTMYLGIKPTEVCFYLKNGKSETHLVKPEDVLCWLSPHKFVQIRDAFVINIDLVIEFKPCVIPYEVTLWDDKKLRVTDKYKDAFKFHISKIVVNVRSNKAKRARHNN